MMRYKMRIGRIFDQQTYKIAFDALIHYGLEKWIALELLGENPPREVTIDDKQFCTKIKRALDSAGVLFWFEKEDLDHR